MGRVKKVILMTMCLALPVLAQFKSQVESRTNVGESLVRPQSSNLLFGWFDPNNLSMHQSYSLSYMSLGGHGLSLGVYTNSLSYQIADPLNVQFDISLMHSPYNSFGNTKDLSGIFLSRAQLNYRLSDNIHFQVQYRQLPSMYWWGTQNSSPGFYNGLGISDEEQH